MYSCIIATIISIMFVFRFKQSLNAFSLVVFSYNSAPPFSGNEVVSMTSEVAKKMEAEAEAAAARAAANVVPPPPEISTLQSEENVSISGSNARLMIMKKLSRNTQASQIKLLSLFLFASVLRFVFVQHFLRFLFVHFLTHLLAVLAVPMYSHAGLSRILV